MNKKQEEVVKVTIKLINKKMILILEKNMKIIYKIYQKLKSKMNY
jgi:hypothetical protein